MRYCFLLLIFSFFLYLPSLNNQLFWDDEQFIYDNVYVKTFDVKNILTQNTIAGAGETSQYYRPLTTLSFAFDYQLWQNNPVGFHLTNTILHSFAGVLLFILLFKLGINKKWALFFAAVFVSHPLQTESVVYANSRGDSLYAFWLFLSYILFTLLWDTQKKQLSLYNLHLKLEKWHIILGVVATFMLAVLSKEIALGGLLLFPIIAVNQQLRTRVQKKHTLQYSIFTILLLILSVAGYFAFRKMFVQLGPVINYYAGTPYGDSIAIRTYTFAANVWTYLQLLIFPYPLHMERSPEVITSLFNPLVLLTNALLFLLFCFGFLEFKKRHSIFIWLGTYWFFALLGPVSGLIPVNGMFYEHWLYTPLVGFLLCGYGLIQLLPHSLLQLLKKNAVPIAAVVIFVYSLLTLRQNYIWGDAIRFYTYTLHFSQTARIRNNLAMAYADRGLEQKAVEEYKKSLEIDATYPQTHYNLAQAYLALGESELAVQEYTKAIDLDPSFYFAYRPLILLHATNQNMLEAEKYLARLEQELPDNPAVVQLRQTVQTVFEKSQK